MSILTIQKLSIVFKIILDDISSAGGSMGLEILGILNEAPL